MPLPYLPETKRCSAKAKSTQQRCHNPAAYNCKTCRLHGARKQETIRKGADHPNYKDGSQTKESKSQHKSSSLHLRELEQLMIDTEMVNKHYKRTVGRKPKNKFDSSKVLY